MSQEGNNYRGRQMLYIVTVNLKRFRSCLQAILDKAELVSVTWMAWLT